MHNISECFIKPKYEVKEAKQPYYLSITDLAMLSGHYIQKGLLFTKPSYLKQSRIFHWQTPPNSKTLLFNHPSALLPTSRSTRHSGKSNLAWKSHLCRLQQRPWCAFHPCCTTHDSIRHTFTPRCSCRRPIIVWSRQSCEPWQSHQPFVDSSSNRTPRWSFHRMLNEPFHRRRNLVLGVLEPRKGI